MNFEDYQQASFRGVPFLVPENSGPLGRNAVEHLYPDSEQHYVEDNGRLLRKYSFPAVIHGKDVKSQFRAIEAALEAPGPGTLLHPNLGPKFVQMGECSYDITQRDAGVVVFTINCCDAGSPTFPNLVSGSGVAIRGLTAKALISMASIFASHYRAPKSPTSVAKIRETLSRVTNALEYSFQSSKKVGELTQAINLPSNTYLPEVLATKLHDVFRAPVKDDDTDNETLYRGWSNIVRKIGPVYEQFDVTTIDLRDREQSLTAIQAFSHSAKLIHFCEAISHFEYTTADQAIRDRQRLSRKQSYVVPTIFPAAKHFIDEIVTETLEYLNSLEVQLPKIEALPVNDYPVGPLAYQLYGPNTDRLKTLININQDRNLLLYNGEVNTLRGG